MFNIPKMIGPFSLKLLIIVIGICAAVTACMYFMKGALSLPINIALWILIAVAIWPIGIIMVFGMTINRTWRWAPEASIFSTARQEGLPVYLEAELGSLVAEFVLGEKNNPKDPFFSDDSSGVKMDPSIMSAEAKPLQLPLGLILYSYGGYNFMPQSMMNHAAFKEIQDYRDEIMKDDILASVPMKEYVELISCPEHHIMHDAQNVLNKYFRYGQALDEKGDLIYDEKNSPVMRHFRKYEKDGKFYEVELTLPDMIKALMKQRNDLATRPIRPGYFTLTEAFVNNSIAASSQWVQHMRMLDRQSIMGEWFRKIDWAAIVPTIMAICGGTAVILAVIFVLAPKAATGGAG